MTKEKKGATEHETTETKVVTFAEMGLAEPIQRTITEVGYETPSPIQAQAIPELLSGHDIIGVAQTGTGKTAAFALPLLSRIDTSSSTPQLLCLAPTRELAIQVAEAMATYGKYLPGFKVLPIYGGADYRGQLRQLGRGVQVIVGTPGRVMDHIRKGSLKLDQIKFLVLDEADEMMSMGFIDDIEWILEQMPHPHQSALFSATMPPRIRQIINKHLKNPVEINVKVKTTTAPTIRQRYIQVRGNEKIDVLTRIMEIEIFDAIIIFVRTKNATQEVAERLQARGYAAEALNGDIAQAQREKTVGRLKKGNIDILVATDVAARGLDVTRISHVINYDVPYDTESYVHRIGRTGRAGREGDAIMFVDGRERRMLQAIERTIRTNIEVYQFPSLEVLNERKKSQLFERIDVALQQDLSEYRSIMSKYQEEREIEPELLAAALASMESGNTVFYIKEAFQPVPPRREQPRDSRDSRGKKGQDRPHKKGERTTHRKTENPGQRSGEKRRVHAAEVPVELYRLEVGESDGATKGQIVGAIANEAGIESRYMGKITIHDKHSFIELPEDMPKKIYKHLRKVWVSGKQLELTKADQKE